MARFHIDKNGLPALCRAAKGNCPLGGADGMQNHFDSKEEAQAFADQQAMSGFESGRLSEAQHAEMSKQYLDVFKNAKVDGVGEGNPRDVNSNPVDTELRFRKLSLEEAAALEGGEKEYTKYKISGGRWQYNNVDVNGELTDEQQEFVDAVYRGHAFSNYNPDGYQEWDKEGINLEKDQAAVLFDDRMSDDSVVLDGNPLRRGYQKREDLPQGDYSAHMDPDEYVNAVGTIYNVAHAKNSKNMSYNEALTTIQAGSVKRGDIKLKMSAKDPEDIKADCGTFAAARKYASEVEGLSSEEIDEIVDNEGLVNHFRKESGLGKRDSSNIVTTNLSLLKEKTGFDPSKYDKRTGYVAAEYAMRKPMSSWNASELETAIADSPHDIKQSYPAQNVSRYDTMRTELGLHPHALVDTKPMKPDEITKYKLWEPNDRMIFDYTDTAFNNGKLVRHKNDDPRNLYDEEGNSERAWWSPEDDSKHMDPNKFK